MTDQITKKRVVTAGHEVPLASMIKHKKIAMINTLSGKAYHGTVHGFDRFTVTLGPFGRADFNESTDERPGPITIFKHSIESFRQAGV